ncbi:VOC family protein [Candidatus Poribacteria bacterium]|nr:VOC family protein [Candidatus Poribacteria bacterium]
MLREMHHTGLSVRNMERSLKLYRDTLGMEVEWDLTIEGIPQFGTIIGLPGVRERIAMMRLSNCRIELFQFFKPKGKKIPRRQCDIGYMHVAMVVDDLDSICRKLKKLGLKFYSKAENLGVYKVVFFKGFDGETIELMMPMIREAKGKS